MMECRVFVLAVFLAVGIGFSAQASARAGKAKVFQKPLILGASVSAGFGIGGKGPGHRVSGRYTSASNIKSYAEDGQKGADLAEDFSEEVFAGRSVVIAVDFLFWDSASPFPGAGKKALDALISYTGEKGIPLVVGDIPNLEGLQLSRWSLNSHIHRACKKERGCHIIKFDQLHQDATSEAGVLIKGKRYRFEDLVQDDGMHLNERGANHVADMIDALF